MSIFLSLGGNQSREFSVTSFIFLSGQIKGPVSSLCDVLISRFFSFSFFFLPELVVFTSNKRLRAPLGEGEKRKEEEGEGEKN